MEGQICGDSSVTGSSLGTNRTPASYQLSTVDTDTSGSAEASPPSISARFAGSRSAADRSPAVISPFLGGNFTSNAGSGSAEASPPRMFARFAGSRSAADRSPAVISPFFGGSFTSNVDSDSFMVPTLSGIFVSGIVVSGVAGPASSVGERRTPESYQLYTVPAGDVAGESGGAALVVNPAGFFRKLTTLLSIPSSSNAGSVDRRTPESYQLYTVGTTLGTPTAFVAGGTTRLASDSASHCS